MPTSTLQRRNEGTKINTSAISQNAARTEDDPTSKRMSGHYSAESSAKNADQPYYDIKIM